MPDEVATATESSAPATDLAPAIDAGATNDSVYDAAFAEFLDAGDESDPAPEPADNPAAAPVPQAQGGAVFSDAELAILGRAKLDPAWFGGRSRQEIEGTIQHLSQMQADADRLGAELARYKAAPQQVQQQPAPQPEPKPQAAKPTPFSQKVEQTINKLKEVYEDDIGGLGELFTELHEQASAYDSRFSEFQSQIETLPVVQEFLTEMAVEDAIDRLAKDYPSIETPEGRKMVSERFWTEWNTGEYAKPGQSFRSQIRAAAQNAAKVIFSNTTEQSAAAALVKANQARVASQPKVGSPNARPTPRTVDDVYNEAFEATIGKEMAGALRR